MLAETGSRAWVLSSEEEGPASYLWGGGLIPQEAQTRHAELDLGI